MKAIVYKGPGEFVIEDRPVPQIQNGDDILVRILGVCICGTDINILSTPQKHPARPDIIFGHEFCGEVVEVAEGVEEFQAGDKIIIDPHGPCGQCLNCRSGLQEMCKYVFLTEEGFEGQADAMGVFKDGGLTSFVVIPEKFAYKIAKDTPPELMSLAEPLACCGYSLEKLNMHVGDTVCILGGGPIGQLYLLLAKASGASKVILSEPIQYRRDKAREHGATRVVDPNKEDVRKVCLEETEGQGVDHCIEAVDFKLMDCIECVRPGGKILHCGHDETALAPIDIGELLKKEVEIHGVFLGKNYFAKAARIIESRVLPLEGIVTHVFPLSKYEEALNLARSGECIKICVMPDEFMRRM